MQKKTEPNAIIDDSWITFATANPGYRWIIMWQKCKDMGLKGFIFEKLNENLNIKDRKKFWDSLGFAF